MRVGRTGEFAERADAFNDMSERVGRLVQAMQIQSAIDREILGGLDLDRVMTRVVARMQSLVPQAGVALLLAPPAFGQWLAFRPQQDAAELALDSAIEAALGASWSRLDRTAAQWACQRLGVAGDRPAETFSMAASWDGRPRVVLLIAVPSPSVLVTHLEREVAAA